jgi:hypothetical protein
MELHSWHDQRAEKHKDKIGHDHWRYKATIVGLCRLKRSHAILALGKTKISEYRGLKNYEDFLKLEYEASF